MSITLLQGNQRVPTAVVRVGGGLGLGTDTDGIATLGSTAYDVTLYGATGDGVTDDGPAVNAAIAAMAAGGGGILYFPPGTYYINTAVTFATTDFDYGLLRIAGSSYSASELLFASAGMFNVGNAPATDLLWDVLIENLTLRCNANCGYADGLMTLDGVREFAVRNVRVYGGTAVSPDQYTCCGLWLDTTYLGLIENYHVRGRYVEAIDFNKDSKTTETVDNISFMNCTFVSVLGVLIRGTGTGAIHDLSFYNMKHVLSPSWSEYEDYERRTLNGAVSAGASSITVDTTPTSIAANDIILIGSDDDCEPAKVSSVSSTTINLVHNTRSAHADGDSVFLGGFGVVATGNTFGINLYSPKCEGGVGMVLTNNISQLAIYEPTMFSRELVTIDEATRGILAMRGTYGGAASTNRVFHSTASGGDFADVKWWTVFGPIRVPAGSPSLTVYVNDAGNTTGRLWNELNMLDSNERFYDTRYYAGGDTQVVQEIYKGTNIVYSLYADGKIEMGQLVQSRGSAIMVQQENTAANSSEKRWRQNIDTATGSWALQTETDAGAYGETALACDRDGTTVDQVRVSGDSGFKVTEYGILFPVLTDATRGSAGTAGRVIFNSDDANLNIDDGTDWIMPDGSTA